MSERANSVSNEALLAIATQHFAEKGFAGARMDEIARDAGVNKATLYYRIGDKEALYRTVLIQHLDIAHDHVRSNVANAGSLIEKLRAHIVGLAQSIESHPSIAALLMREVAAGAGHIDEQALQRMHGIRNCIVEILQQGQQQGLFKPANNFLIHLQIVGTLMFYSAGAPVRQRMADITQDDSYRSPLLQAAEELADSILQSVLLTHEDHT